MMSHGRSTGREDGHVKPTSGLTEEQRSTAGPAVAWVAVATVALGMIYALTYFVGGTNPRTLWDDPSALTGWPWYLGVVTVAGVVLWVITGTTSLMAASFAQEPHTRRALRGFGLLTIFLGVDDQILVHDHLLPDLVGLPEPIVLTSYAVAAIALALRYRRFFLGTPQAPALLLGAFLLAVSVGLDGLKPPFPGRSSLEESTKILGLVAFSVFSIRTALALGRSSPVPVEGADP